MSRKISRLLIRSLMVSIIMLLVLQSVAAAESSVNYPNVQESPVNDLQFTEIAPQGFGDRQNSGAWSMAWWNGKLYVATVRSWYCYTYAWIHTQLPQLPYPPPDPDLDCAPDYLDLPLQGEIWRYSPDIDTWDRVYQAPMNVEIPGHPGRFTGRDMGYRSMIVFEESDGTEALYVAGATAYAIYPPMPPPRILRSVDGETFEPIPQNPGTVMGNLGQDQTSFRSMETLHGRLFVINGKAQGQGYVMVSENPAAGDDNFSWLTDQDLLVFEMEAYNGFLYVGTADRSGYGVVKVDVAGEPPYEFTSVITNGAFRPRPSESPVSMHVFQDRLYVGTDDPTEIIRINPDDSWDLIVGTSRLTPDGWKYPLSGLDTGFDWPYAAHMWRMEDHDGSLYVGTNDSTFQRSKWWPGLYGQYQSQFGFDLYSTSDGQYFTPNTINGFGDPYQVGIRSFASTPHGLFVGTVSLWYGLRIWQGTPVPAAAPLYTTFMPLLLLPDQGRAQVSGDSNELPDTPKLALSSPQPSPPSRLQAEVVDKSVVLSWERPVGAAQFRVLRADFLPAQHEETDYPDDSILLPGPYVEIGISQQDFYVDRTVQSEQPYQYLVITENRAGQASSFSNLARVPSLGPRETFHSVQQALDKWTHPFNPQESWVISRTPGFFDALEAFRSQDLSTALREIEQLHQRVKGRQVALAQPWRASDLELKLFNLARRIRLAEAGLIDAQSLLGSETDDMTPASAQSAPGPFQIITTPDDQDLDLLKHLGALVEENIR